MLNFTCYYRDAWDGVKGTSKEEAQKKYVELLCGVRLSPHYHTSLLDS